MVDITDRQLVMVVFQEVAGCSLFRGHCSYLSQCKTVKPAVSMHSEIQTKRVHDGTLLHNLEQ